MKKFTIWNEAHSAGYYTKVQLADPTHFSPTRKPIDIIEPDALFTNSYYGDYPLYHIEETEISRYYIKQPLSITSLNLGYSLYFINRATKKLRDKKNSLDELLDNGESRKIQKRQLQLYMLKRQVIIRLFIENAINIIGYHKKDFTWQSNYWDALDEEREVMASENRNTHFYILYGNCNFKFHLPSTFNEIQHLRVLGKSEVFEVRDLKIPRLNINKAEELLERYLLSEHPIQKWESKVTN